MDMAKAEAAPVSIEAFLAPGQRVVLWSEAGGMTGRGARELVTVLDHDAIGLLVVGVDGTPGHRGNQPQFIPWANVKALEAVTADVDAIDANAE